MEEAGYGIGQRVIELIGGRDRVTKRETRLVNMLQYVSNVVWKFLFNKVADNLERSTENEDECKLNAAMHYNHIVSTPVKFVFVLQWLLSQNVDELRHISL